VCVCVREREREREEQRYFSNILLFNLGCSSFLMQNYCQGRKCRYFYKDKKERRERERQTDKHVDR
jgi:hypothetical protein